MSTMSDFANEFGNLDAEALSEVVGLASQISQFLEGKDTVIAGIALQLLSAYAVDLMPHREMADSYIKMLEASVSVARIKAERLPSGVAQ